MKYPFYADVQSTITERHHYTIEANSSKEATRIMMNIIESEDYDNCHLKKTEIIEESIEPIPLTANNGEPTAILYDAEGNYIADNTYDEE